MSFDVPQSRNEAILQNMLGAHNELEPPQSRMEALLQQLLEAGGGGGGGDAKPLIVNVNSTTLAADKTYADIKAAINAGESVVFKVPVLGTTAYLGNITVGSSSITVNGTGWMLAGFLIVYQLTNADTGSLAVLPIPEDAVTEDVSGATPTINASGNHVYKCGEVTGLTVSSQSGSWSLIFTSGATPTNLSMPSSVHMPDGFAVEANRRYEINVSDGYAVAASWEVSA